MLQPTHTFPETTTRSGVLDFHRIDPDTLGQALTDLNKIVDKNAYLLRHDPALAREVLRYENHLIDAQGGDNEALKLATAPEEFDKLIELSNTQNPLTENEPVHFEGTEREANLQYHALREDLLRFKHQYLSASRVD
ncbi:MAG: hypothetical protein MK052_04790 [Alphaproteobacteria bacterium]|nr:hypothetical protein [Alphaproteobacteria bacterium]